MIFKKIFHEKTNKTKDPKKEHKLKKDGDVYIEVVNGKKRILTKDDIVKQFSKTLLVILNNGKEIDLLKPLKDQR